MLGKPTVAPGERTKSPDPFDRFRWDVFPDADGSSIRPGDWPTPELGRRRCISRSHHERLLANQQRGLTALIVFRNGYQQVLLLIMQAGGHFPDYGPMEKGVTYG